MNNRKRLLAYVRNGNYAHAGEAEAIDLTTKLIEQKNKNQKILDIGCGLGGTADYIEKCGFGTVTGIDIDSNVLKQAKELYPNISFHLGDANEVNTFFADQTFNIFYSFNAFFCFKNQENCLRALASRADKGAELLIFDYSSPGFYSKQNPFAGPTDSLSAQSFTPINLMTIDDVLLKSHWQLKNIINLDDKYQYWYQSLISKIKTHQSDLIQKFGQTTFDDLYAAYIKLLALIKEGELGGCIVHAKLLEGAYESV